MLLSSINLFPFGRFEHFRNEVTAAMANGARFYGQLSRFSLRLSSIAYSRQKGLVQAHVFPPENRDFVQPTCFCKAL